jgi:hypothetical protein
MEATALVPDQISGLSYGHDIQGCYVCAGFGEAARYALPEAARRSCYQGDLAVEAKVVEYAH